MNILWGAPDERLNVDLGTWLAVRLGFSRPFQPPYTTMGVFEGRKLISVILYNNYQPETGVIEIHGASITPRWLTKPVLWAMFDMPFNRLGCQMVVMRVSDRDRRLLRILKAYGFKHVIVPRLRGRDEGERVFWLTDDAWRANGFHPQNTMPNAA